MMQLNYEVYVQCMTYNHAKYIKDALDGFCMQQTNFPFVCGIIDDASTDGEQEVINHYLYQHFDMYNEEFIHHEENDDFSRVFVRHRTNLNCFFLVVFLKSNHYIIRKLKDPYVSEWRDKAKYIALCEGDDYWIDPQKLQKQVDFMEKHPNHSLCFSNNIKLYSDGHEEIKPRYPNDMDYCPIRDLISEGGGAMSTHTMFYRQSLYYPYSNWAMNSPVGDLPMMLSLAAKGEVGFMSDVMGVHRFETIGSWTSKISSDINRKINLNKAIILIYKQFDEWTKKRYHKDVRKKICRIKLAIVKTYLHELFKKK